MRRQPGFHGRFNAEQENVLLESVSVQPAEANALGDGDPINSPPRSDPIEQSIDPQIAIEPSASTSERNNTHNQISTLHIEEHTELPQDPEQSSTSDKVRITQLVTAKETHHPEQPPLTIIPSRPDVINPHPPPALQHIQLPNSTTRSADDNPPSALETPSPEPNLLHNSAGEVADIEAAPSLELNGDMQSSGQNTHNEGLSTKERTPDRTEDNEIKLLISPQPLNGLNITTTNPLLNLNN